MLHAPFFHYLGNEKGLTQEQGFLAVLHCRYNIINKLFGGSYIVTDNEKAIKVVRFPSLLH